MSKKIDTVKKLKEYEKQKTKINNLHRIIGYIQLLLNSIGDSNICPFCRSKIDINILKEEYLRRKKEVNKLDLSMHYVNKKDNECSYFIPELDINKREVEIKLIQYDFNIWSIRTNPESYINKSYYQEQYQKQTKHNIGIILNEYLGVLTHDLYNGNTNKLEIIIIYEKEI